ncbi:hypothetical protein LC613_08960 [Nostoc sphaeroides CHAB 2801]|uniref:hypothetical protein n=1 Tax=Nostoc sphaeroides TaxID=446679 RepID=UPI0015F311A4|nr:hypothetical protein [Nostoc sphaeroides]MCC5628239.1 hypothetical protein [Nostoc sphaeroides CHAB 2801]
MSRQRVPKGQVFLKKEEKIAAALERLPPDHSDAEFIAKFREQHESDWQKIVARYEAHERLTKPGKSHPMPPPEKYLLNAARTQRLYYKKFGSLQAFQPEG